MPLSFSDGVCVGVLGMIVLGFVVAGLRIFFLSCVEDRVAEELWERYTNPPPDARPTRLSGVPPKRGGTP